MERSTGNFGLMTMIFVLVLFIAGVLLGDPFICFIKLHDLLKALLDMAGLLI